MKVSKVRRKELNAMRQMGEVAWPARRFRYPPTFGTVQVVGRCPRVVGAVPVKKPGMRHRLRRPVQTSVVCGGDIVLVPLKGIHCVSCRDRGAQARMLERLKRQKSVRLHTNGAPRPEKRLGGRLLGRLRRGQRGA